MNRLKRAVGAGLLATLLASSWPTTVFAKSSSAVVPKEELMIKAPLVEQYLLDGRLKAGEMALTAHLKKKLL